MNRRYFIRKMFTAVKSLVMLSLLPNTSMLNASDHSAHAPLHYKPLNGRDLRKISLKNQHHAAEGFINPLGPMRRSRFWKVMSWKLFHENRFKEHLSDQALNPISIDWDPIRRHRGL